jgi:(R,R)-butanediol dehydrogenase/meso-butanediol dehydrogenase/diacetyl reductase
VRIDDIPKPEKLGPDEVLVKNRYCGICGTDLHEYAAGPIFISSAPNGFSDASVPQILGHEFGGRIEAVGRDVRHLHPGVELQSNRIWVHLTAISVPAACISSAAEVQQPD